MIEQTARSGNVEAALTVTPDYMEDNVPITPTRNAEKIYNFMSMFLSFSSFKRLALMFVDRAELEGWVGIGLDLAEGNEIRARIVKEVSS